MRLAEPRLVTLFGLLILGGIAGDLAWRYFDVALLSWLSGLASSFCLMCAAAVWGMRDKSAVLTAAEGTMTARQFAQRALAEDKMIQRSTVVAAIVALCALAASSTILAQQFKAPIWEWMAAGGGAATGAAAFGYLLANSWEVQLRQLKYADTLEQKKISERNQVLERLAVQVKDSDAIPYWAEPKGELTKMDGVN